MMASDSSSPHGAADYFLDQRHKLGMDRIRQQRRIVFHEMPQQDVMLALVAAVDT